MNIKWINTKIKGIRYYESDLKRNGLRKDRNYYVRYTHPVTKKRYEEPLGWESDLSRNLKRSDILGVLSARFAELKESHKTGKGPQTFKEIRETEETQRKTAREDHERIEKENITFNYLWKEYYYPQALQDKKSSSMVREERLFRLWISPSIGSLPLKNISPFDIEKLKKKMNESKLMPRTIQYCLAVTRQVFNYAKTKDIFKGDSPTSKVKWPTVENAKLRFINKEEANKLLEELKKRSQQVYEMSLLSLHCGLRFDEVTKIKWQDINIDEGFFYVRDAKNKKSRMAFMTRPIKDMFQNITKGKPDAPVFKSSKGEKIKYLSHTFNKAVKELKLNEGITDRRHMFTYHTLRHSFASYLAIAGKSAPAIKEALGQETLVMANRYIHFAPDSLKDIANVIEKALGETTNPSNVINLSSRNN